mmetsp:Transcript_24401/g.83415  ORF Transcript_24401/g.83415 Transcript_24401/m.83415 type:complete len:240 (-) Transcript_24401:983-1702(-)
MAESIYKLLPPEQVIPPKPAMHVSKHPGVVDPNDFDMGVPHRSRGTFGPPNGASAASDYLKKHSGEPLLPEPTKPTNPKTKSKPPVPRKLERPVMGLVSAKNFVTSNAVENILSQPRKIEIEPMLATQKPDYGQVPSYLKKVKEQVALERSYIEEQTRIAEEQAAAGSLRKMSETERQTLIVELKNKWGRVNEAYQKLPFTLDTPMRRMRKEKYEAELTQLEKDIETLNRKNVLVADNY